MMKSKDWFIVNKEGLKALQKGKPKTFIINELCQNAWDENIKKCILDITYDSKKGEVTVRIEDDSPEGFKDIALVYTMFADTYKRKDPTKRGRFVVGEKQVISICRYAKVVTTKGTVVFDDDGRTETTDHRKVGSEVIVIFEATEDEFKELKEHAKNLLCPPNIKFIVNLIVIPSKPIHKTFEATLITEVLNDNVFTLTRRKTTINLVESNGKSYIYEMGIPVMETDCPYHIDVQQKIPVAVDRETIKDYYVQDLYAEVLNHIHDEVEPEQSSSLWIRTAMKDDRVTKESVDTVTHKRYGDKFCIANPNDRHAMEEAISHGYKPIYGSELSKEEWDQIKSKNDIQSVSQIYDSKTLVAANEIEPNAKQLLVAKYAIKVAKRLLGIDITVRFVDNRGVKTAAQYGNRTLTFNVGHPWLQNGFFDTPVNIQNTKFIIHELSHEKGSDKDGLGHIDYEYQELQSTLGANLVILMRDEPEFFEVN